jgi:hypothetical protein
LVALNIQDAISKTRGCPYKKPAAKGIYLAGKISFAGEIPP